MVGDEGHTDVADAEFGRECGLGVGRLADQIPTFCGIPPRLRARGVPWASDYDQGAAVVDHLPVASQYGHDRAPFAFREGIREAEVHFLVARRTLILQQ
jgi:hypothetical protein